MGESLENTVFLDYYHFALAQIVSGSCLEVKKKKGKISENVISITGKHDTKFRLF